MPPSLHEAVAGLAFLLGTWRGEGTGLYPTIDPFSYVEETRFWHDGRPLLLYAQTTTAPGGGPARHAESGFWRPAPGGAVELVVAHSFGIVEVGHGSARERRVEIASTSLVATPSAKRVDAVARTIEVDGDVLSYRLDMAYGGHPLQPHLSARLERA